MISKMSNIYGASDRTKYCEEEDFKVMKEQINNAETRLIQQDIVEFLRETNKKYDVIHLSNVTGYIKDDKLVEELFDLADNHLNPGGISILYSFLGPYKKERKEYKLLDRKGCSVKQIHLCRDHLNIFQKK